MFSLRRMTMLLAVLGFTLPMSSLLAACPKYKRICIPCEGCNSANKICDYIEIPCKTRGAAARTERQIEADAKANLEARIKADTAVNKALSLLEEGSADQKAVAADARAALKAAQKP